MTLHTERVRTLDEVRAFVEGSEAVDFAVSDREGIYRLIQHPASHGRNGSTKRNRHPGQHNAIATRCQFTRGRGQAEFVLAV